MGDPEGATPAVASEPEALRLDIDRQEEYNRWLPLVKWLLVIPHLIVLVFVVIGAAFVVLFAFFAVLITGRFPRGAFDYLVGAYRWGTRVNAYVRLMVDPYPPFSLAHDPAYPARLELDYPERVERWRPLVAWLLIIPYVIVAYLINIVAAVAHFIAFFAILFTKQYPQVLFDIVLIGTRWNARAVAYAHFALTKYPEFEWR